jgi:tyrosine-protein kinase Etk/Wzc
MRRDQMPPLGPQSVSEVDVTSALAVLWKYRMTVAATTAAFVLLALAYSLLATPVYQSRLMAQIEDTSDANAASSKGLMNDVSTLFVVKPLAEGEIQLFTSNYVVSRAVDALGLFVTAVPHYFPVVGPLIARHNDNVSAPGLFGWGGFAWGNESIDVSRFNVPRQFEGEPFQLEAAADGTYTLRGPAFKDPATGRVGVEETFTTSRGAVTLLVQKIVGSEGATFELTRHSRQQTITSLQRSVQVTEQGTKSGVLLAKLKGHDSARVSATLNALGNAYIVQNGERKSNYAASSLEFLKTQLPSLKQRVEQAEQEYAKYRNARSIVDLDEDGRSLLRQSVEAETNLMMLQQKRQEITSRFTGDHADVVIVRGQIALAEQRVRDVAERIKRLPDAEKDSLALLREVRVTTGLYAGLLNNIEELKLLSAGKIGSVRVIDPAEAAEVPMWPNKSLLLAGAALAGLFCGAGAAFLRNARMKGVMDARSLEDDTGLGVMACIPLSVRQRERLLPRPARPTPQEPALLAVSHPHDPTIESLRMLRTTLLVAMSTARNNVVLLTGPLPGIGKSFVSSNLAAVLAAAGQRVLLIDGDMRRGRLHERVDIEEGNGLADVLAANAALAGALHRDVQPGLDFLMAGHRPSNPAELLLSERWKNLIEVNSSRYDVVLIDAPAVLPVADAAIMASVAGSIFLVARFGETRSDEMVESMRALSQAGAQVRGILLNGIDAKGSGRYGYVRTYGSYVSYGYDDDGHAGAGHAKVHH